MLKPTAESLAELLHKTQEPGLNRLLEMTSDLLENQRHSAWENYQPLPHQLKFHRSQAQIRCFIGGNRSGKTTAGIMEILWYALGRHPYRTVLAPNSLWIVALDNEVMGDVILPKLFEYLPEEFIKSFNKVRGTLELTNGTIIKMKSCDSGPEKFQSAERRAIWFDEEPPQEIWKECLMRAGAMYPLDIILTMTPLQGMDWTYEELIQKARPGHLEVFGASLADNYHLLPSERQRIIEEFEHSDEADARLHGRYFHKSGLIYKGLREELHLVDPFPIPPEWPFIRAIDPHPRKPSAALWGALAPDGTIYVTDELNDDREMLFSQFAERVREIDGQRHIIRAIIDPSSRQGTSIGAGGNIIDHLADLGLPCMLANNDTKVGYDAVRSKLSTPDGVKLKFFRTCPKTWKQMNHLVYDEWRFRSSTRDVKEVQKKKNDDLADCVRYICAEKIEWESPDKYSIERTTQSGGHKYTGY